MDKKVRYEKPSLVKEGSFRKTTAGLRRLFADQLVGRRNI